MKKAVRTRTSLWRKFLVLGITTGVLLVAVEAAVRLRQHAKYGTTAATVNRTQFDPESGLTIPTPGSKTGPIHINELGFRSPSLENPKPAKRVRIAFLGGSTTFCAEATETASTWPALLIARLREVFPSVAFDYVNGGSAGYTTTQSMINLERRVAPLAPDIVIIYHATNDLSADSRGLAIERGLSERVALPVPSGDHFSLAWYLFRKNVLYRSRKVSEASEILTFDPRELSPPFRERLAALITQAQRVAGLVVVPTFSLRARRAQGAAEQRVALGSSLYYMPYLDPAGLLNGFDEYNRVIRELVPGTGALLVGGEESIPGDAEHFKDTVHFTDRGCERMAARVLDALVDSEAFESLLAERAGWKP